MPVHVPSLHPACKSRGFSLVEVVVLMSLLGMASAFAVPRFTSFANHLRASAVMALSANLQEATQMAHAQFMASGSTLAAATLQGKVITLKNGYPEASTRGIGRAVHDWSGFTAKTDRSFITFFKTGAPQDAHCSVTYRASADPAMAPVISDVHIGGC